MKYIINKINKIIRIRLTNNPWRKLAIISDFKNYHRNWIYLKDIDVKLNVNEFEFLLEGYQYAKDIKTQLDGFFSISEDKLWLAIGSLRINIQTAEELFIINEIWIEGCYNFDFSKNKKIILVDVGMNVGLASLFFASKDEITRIYSFEPFPDTYNQAIFNLSLNTKLSKKISPHDFGLSNKEELMEVEYAPEQRGRTGVWGTELILDKVKSKFKEKILVKSFNIELNKIIKENNNLDIVLKIDCEGSEYDIFDKVDKNILKNVKIIMLEWHKKGPEQIQEILNTNGFKTLSFYPKSNKTGMLYAFK